MAILQHGHQAARVSLSVSFQTGQVDDSYYKQQALITAVSLRTMSRSKQGSKKNETKLSAVACFVSSIV